MELDETYEMTLHTKQKQTPSVNHREFITWREFTTYFDDYREIKKRNKKTDLRVDVSVDLIKSQNKKD